MTLPSASGHDARPLPRDRQRGQELAAWPYLGAMEDEAAVRRSRLFRLPFDSAGGHQEDSMTGDTTSLVPRTSSAEAVMMEGSRAFTPMQVELIKRTIARGATDDELALFMNTANRLGLDPFARQIYSIRRKEKDPDTGQWVERQTTQVSIDGMRLVADRTGCYAPGPAPRFRRGQDEILVAISAVKKYVRGEWHLVEAEARFDEFAQMYSGKPSFKWAQMPHHMLAKCAEAQALRRAFPQHLSGAYLAEEMNGDVVEAPAVRTVAPQAPQSTAMQAMPAGDTPAASPGYHTDPSPEPTAGTREDEGPRQIDWYVAELANAEAAATMHARTVEQELEDIKARAKADSRVTQAELNGIFKDQYIAAMRKVRAPKP